MNDELERRLRSYGQVLDEAATGREATAVPAGTPRLGRRGLAVAGAIAAVTAGALGINGVVGSDSERQVQVSSGGEPTPTGPADCPDPTAEHIRVVAAEPGPGDTVAVMPPDAWRNAVPFPRTRSAEARSPAACPAPRPNSSGSPRSPGRSSGPGSAPRPHVPTGLWSGRRCAKAPRKPSATPVPPARRQRHARAHGNSRSSTLRVAAPTTERTSGTAPHRPSSPDGKTSPHNASRHSRRRQPAPDRHGCASRHPQRMRRAQPWRITRRRPSSSVSPSRLARDAES